MELNNKQVKCACRAHGLHAAGILLAHLPPASLKRPHLGPALAGRARVCDLCRPTGGLASEAAPHAHCLVGGRARCGQLGGQLKFKQLARARLTNFMAHPSPLAAGNVGGPFE